MNNIKDIISRAGKAVAAVFSGFGGFLFNVQPPEGVLKGFTVGFATAISALLFLVISVFVQAKIGKKYRNVLLILSLALVAGAVITGLQYQNTFSSLTVDFPGHSGVEKVVIGDQLTSRAAAHEAETGEPVSALLLDFGGKDHREQVWTRESVNKAKVRLSNSYLRMSVFIAAAVFCMAELLFPSSARPSGAT